MRWSYVRNRWKPENICLAAIEDQKVIGTATAINYSNQVAWIGMVLVDQEYRGRGVSKLLLTGLFEKLNSCKSIKLDATPAGKPVYQKFDIKTEYLIHRMTIDSASVQDKKRRKPKKPKQNRAV